MNDLGEQGPHTPSHASNLETPPLPPPPPWENQPPRPDQPPPGVGAAPPGQPWASQAPTQYSSDGRYFWNGYSWVPVSPQSGAPKSKVAAGVLAILLGDFGVHKFYLGQTGVGIIYLVFFWTFIPGLISIAEGIVFLTLSDADFAARYGTAELARQRPMF